MMCCRRGSVAVAVAEALGRGLLGWLVGFGRWHLIGPLLLRSRLGLGSGPWRMGRMCGAKVRGHLSLYCQKLDGSGEVCGSRRQSCHLRRTDCSRYRTGRDVDER